MDGDPIRYCAACGEQLIRKRFNERLEDRSRFLKRLCCRVTRHITTPGMPFEEAA
jgi:hypothetical protein